MMLVARNRLCIGKARWITTLHFFFFRSCKLICVKALVNKTYFSEHSRLARPTTPLSRSFTLLPFFRQERVRAY